MFNEVQPEIQGCGGGPRKRAPTKSFSNNNGIYTMHSQVSCIYSSLLSLLPLQDRSQKHQLAFWGLLPLPEAKAKGGEAAFVPAGSRKTPPCLCSRDQEADTSLGHSTYTSSALGQSKARFWTTWKLLQEINPWRGLPAAAESWLLIHTCLPNLIGAQPLWQKLNLAKPYLKGVGEI